MLGRKVHGDGHGDAGNVGEAAAGILMVVSLEDVVHDKLQATSRTRSLCQTTLAVTATSTFDAKYILRVDLPI